MYLVLNDMIKKLFILYVVKYLQNHCGVGHSSSCYATYRSHTVRSRYIQEEERKYVYSQLSHSISCHAAARRVVPFTLVLFRFYIHNMLNILLIFVFALWWMIRYYLGRKNGEVKVYGFNSNPSEIVESSKINTDNI